jgi:hypothetical protein
MAIFHLNESNISRSDGRSAVACAAYRACEKLEDHTYGKTQDYTRKKGLEYKSIYAPEHTNEKLLDRQTLWNEVEKKEFNANGSMKENARLAKEYICALPHELTDRERIKIVDDFCRDFVKKHNVIVDACIHAPHDNDDETNNKNYHVHIMFTTRLVNQKGELGKKQRTFNDDGPKVLKDSRATFANVVNTALENAGLDERIDHRSYKEQGLELEATQHEGPEVTQLRRKGIETEISLKNDAIKQRNLDRMQLPGLDQQIVATERLTQQLEQQRKAELEQRKEAERLELEQQQQAERLELERDLARFYELQSAYSDITKTALDLHKRKEAEIEKIKKVRKKIKDFVAKCPRNDSILRTEEVAYEQKKGYVPKYYITEALAAEKIRAITRTHEKELRAATRAVGFLKMAVELKTLHRKLLDQNIELEIPREKKVFGITLRATPPSAETLDEDLKEYYFRPLGDDFEYAYKQATKTDAQKRRDAQEQERYRQQEAQRRERELLAEQQAAAEDAVIDKAIETLRRDCGYGPDSDYNALHPQIPNISGLIVSELVKGRDVSGYVTQKIEMLEPELGKGYVKTYEDRVFGQIFELLNADRKLLKDDPKNLSKINGFYQKLQNHITEQAEIEQARLERDRVQSLEKKPTINAQKTKKLDNGRDNNHGLSM